MAFDAACARSPRLVKVVLRRVVAIGKMALRAQGVALGEQCQAVRFVAVAAGHAFPVHLALHERAVDVHLAEDLPVGVVEPLCQQRGNKRVEQRLTGPVVGVDLHASGVALCAGVHLCV